MPKYTVDGSFFVQQLSGIQRYAREILAAMDPMLEPGELEVAVPPDCIVPEYRNIKVVTPAAVQRHFGLAAGVWPISGTKRALLAGHVQRYSHVPPWERGHCRGA